LGIREEKEQKDFTPDDAGSGSDVLSDRSWETHAHLEIEGPSLPRIGARRMGRVSLPCAWRGSRICLIHAAWDQVFTKRAQDSQGFGGRLWKTWESWNVIRGFQIGFPFILISTTGF